MSLTNTGRKGRSQNGIGIPAEGRFADAVAAALHRQYGDSHGAIKSVMRLTGLTERTVKKWFQAKNAPSCESLFRLCRHSDQVLETVLRLSGHERLLKMKKLREIRGVLQKMLSMTLEIES